MSGEKTTLSEGERKQMLDQILASAPAQTPEEKAAFDKEIAEANERINRKQERAAASILRGKRNIYTCDECFGHIVTVDLTEGVTPFGTGCKCTEGCKGMMQSSVYQVFDQRMKPSHEWYKPSEPELAAMKPGTQEHVRRGGLVLRKCAE